MEPLGDADKAFRLLEQLNTEMGHTQKPEEGFYDSKWYSSHWKAGRTTTNRKLQRAVSLGLIEMKTFRTSKNFSPVRHYRIK